jgi:hypothetical protein
MNTAPNNNIPIWLSVATVILVSSVILYLLFRAWKYRVVYLYGRSGVMTTRRDLDPLGYWFLMVIYALLIPLLFWGLHHRLQEFKQQTTTNNTATEQH